MKGRTWLVVMAFIAGCASTIAFQVPRAHADGKPLQRWEHWCQDIDGVPTKHFLREELEAALDARGFKVEAIEKLEYGWNTEFEAPPRWMKEPYPWDWFVTARRMR